MLRVPVNSALLKFHSVGFSFRLISISAQRHGRRPLGISVAIVTAASRGSRCLSEYGHSRLPLIWQCGTGHVWRARFDNVKYNKSWCPVCARLETTVGIDIAKQIAAARGGACLSKTRQDAVTKLDWQCSVGHQFKAFLLDVKNKGNWCPRCARTKRSLRMESGPNSRRKLGWQCSEEHVWKASLANVKNEGWCPECYHLRTKLTIDVAKGIAAAHGGRCLSEDYQNIKTKLDWECSEGHSWPATLDSVKHMQSWCPKCCKRGVQRTRSVTYSKHFFADTFSRAVVPISSLMELDINLSWMGTARKSAPRGNFKDVNITMRSITGTGSRISSRSNRRGIEEK